MRGLATQLARRPLRRVAAVAAPARPRALSYQFNVGGVVDRWPRTAPNTILVVCPQGEKMIVERLGKMHDIKDPGFFFAIPLIDRIAYRVDMRERTLEIAPQAAITKDNVSVDVSGNVYVQFVDPERAAYGSQNPLYAVRQLAQSAMRAAIGEMELDEILHARARLNDVIREALAASGRAWGIDIKRYEITEITPDKHISEAMDKQAASERERREKVKMAEGDKQAMTLASEGVRVSQTNESEGAAIAVRNAASAEREKRILEAEGEAEAMQIRAKAQAEAIASIATAIEGQRAGPLSAQLAVARDYIGMYGELAGKSNTMLFAERPGDLNALLAQAATVLKNTPDPPKE